MTRTVVGVFDYAHQSEEAIRELTAAGFRNEDISFAKLGPDSHRAEEMAHDAAAGESAALGAAGGAMIGGLGGLLLGLGLLAIPGLGPLAAAGPIVAALTGAGVGAGVGGVTGAFMELGIPEEEALYYADEIRRGGSVVAVQAEEHRAWQAEEVLRRHGAVDIERRREGTRSPANASPSMVREPAVASSATLERPAVPSQIPSDDDTAAWDKEFLDHYKRNFGTADRTFDELQPAYEYGYHASSDPRFLEGDWEDTEANIRQDWSTRGHGAWDEVKDAVHCGWSCGRSRKSTMSLFPGERDDPPFAI